MFTADEMIPFLRSLSERMEALTKRTLAEDRSESSLAGLAELLHERIGYHHTTTYKRYQAVAVQKRLPMLACGRGCAWCCYQSVAVTMPEALAVIAWLRANKSPEEIEALRLVLKSHHEALRQWKANPTGREFVHPCAFLVEGVCTIHPVRPAACRGFNSNNADTCKHNFDHPDQQRERKFFHVHWDIALELRLGLMRGLADQGLEDSVYEFVGVVNEIFEDPEIVDRYLKGESPLTEHILVDPEEENHP